MVRKNSLKKRIFIACIVLFSLIIILNIFIGVARNRVEEEIIDLLNDKYKNKIIGPLDDYNHKFIAVETSFRIRDNCFIILSRSDKDYWTYQTVVYVQFRNIFESIIFTDLDNAEIEIGEASF